MKNKKLSKIIIILLMIIIIVIGLNLIDEVKDLIKKPQNIINLNHKIDTIKLNLNNANIYVTKGKGKIKTSKNIKLKKENNILIINSNEEKIDVFIETSNIERLDIKALNSDIEIDDIYINHLDINSDYLKLDLEDLKGSSLNVTSSKASIEIDDLYVDNSLIKSGAGTTKISLEDNNIDASTSLGFIKYNGKKMTNLKIDKGKYYINLKQKLGKILIKD